MTTNKIETKQIMLDTPFLTKGITDTESNCTTLREALKASTRAKEKVVEISPFKRSENLFSFKSKTSAINSVSSRRYSPS